MKKIFLIVVVLLMMINFIINYHHEVTKDQHTPMADFKTKVEMAPMKEYNDPGLRLCYQVSLLLPAGGYFRYRDTRAMPSFSFTNHANIILESYVTP